MLSNDEITELLDTVSRSFDASSVSVKALGLTITTFKVQELLGTFISKSTAGPPSEITLLCLICKLYCAILSQPFIIIP
jgi:hypothetical protein